MVVFKVKDFVQERVVKYLRDQITLLASAGGNFWLAQVVQGLTTKMPGF